MGILSVLVAYKIGRRRGRAQRVELPINDGRDPLCINFETFCRNFGSCDGMECEYE